MNNDVIIPRSLLEQPEYFAKKFTKGQALLDLFFLATKDKYIPMSELKMAERWKWNRLTVKRFICILEERGVLSRVSVDNNAVLHITMNKNLSSCVENKPSKQQSKRFVPPTVEEVAQYIAEKGYTFDAETFVAFYESKGWVVGKAKMKDWKACCRTWETGRKKTENKTSNIKHVTVDNPEKIPDMVAEKVKSINTFWEWLEDCCPMINAALTEDAPDNQNLSRMRRYNKYGAKGLAWSFLQMEKEGVKSNSLMREYFNFINAHDLYTGPE